MLKVLTRAIDMIGYAGASIADVIGSWRQHVVIDGELAAVRNNSASVHWP